MDTRKQTGRRRRYDPVRWMVAGAALLAIVIYESAEWNWQSGSSSSWWNALDVFLVGLLGACAYVFTDRMLRLYEERNQLRQDLTGWERLLDEARQRQNTLIHVSQMYLETNEEGEVVDLTLRLSRELLGARGASFVPLDENAQPLQARSQGEMPFSETNAWLEYLASPGVREACAACQHQEQLTHTCPLLEGAFQNSRGVYCVPLRRGGQDYGILNLFLPKNSEIDADTQALLKTLVDESAVAFESLRMRQRAMNTLHQLQGVREKTDLNGLLQDLLISLRETLEADFVRASVWEGSQADQVDVTTGVEIPDNSRLLIEGIVQSVAASREPVLLENAVGASASAQGVRAILAAPLIASDSRAKGEVLGVILAASRRARAFNQRQLSILQMIASQVSLVVQNVRLVAQLEYKTVIEERMRLAREIHDGLAQTLGFLKLKTAQMRMFLEEGEDQLLREAVEAVYDVLAEAYQDARQAIDGLRVSSKEGFEGWFNQTVEEFRESSGVAVNLCDLRSILDLPPEMHAQLIRIIQEALNNIRKHAHARRVEIACRRSNQHLLLEISDDGDGFNVEDVPGPSQHGLRGMRERAELIGADLQVVSQAGNGTLVRLLLPAGEKEKLP